MGGIFIWTYEHIVLKVVHNIIILIDWTPYVCSAAYIMPVHYPSGDLWRRLYTYYSTLSWPGKMWFYMELLLGDGACNIMMIIIMPYSYFTYIDLYTDKNLSTLQKLKYDIHTKLALESYRIHFWYDSSGNLVWISYFSFCSAKICANFNLLHTCT